MVAHQRQGHEHWSDVFEFKHDGCNVATLDKDKLKELVQYIQMAIL